MTLTHIFGECDLDLEISAKLVWKKLFDICEATGFMPSQEKYGFSVVGPFNISDSFDLEIKFGVKKHPVSKIGYVVLIKAFLRDANTRELKQTWEIYSTKKQITESEVPML